MSKKDNHNKNWSWKTAIRLISIATTDLGDLNTFGQQS